MIYIKNRHKKIIDAILQNYPYSFFAFGSRIKGTHRQLSDLDICFIENIPLVEQSNIKEAFELSNLPFTVDLVDFNNCDTNFKNRILQQYIVLQGSDLLLQHKQHATKK